YGNWVQKLFSGARREVAQRMADTTPIINLTGQPLSTRRLRCLTPTYQYESSLLEDKYIGLL
ncbi:MAG: hypothetical protein WC147_08345, partial [Syntrophomonas sp.]